MAPVSPARCRVPPALRRIPALPAILPYRFITCSARRARTATQPCKDVSHVEVLALHALDAWMDITKMVPFAPDALFLALSVPLLRFARGVLTRLMLLLAADVFYALRSLPIAVSAVLVMSALPALKGCMSQ